MSSVIKMNVEREAVTLENTSIYKLFGNFLRYLCMISADKPGYEVFYQKSITHLETAGYENIKADFEGYDKPKSYLKKGSEVSITPDIVAEKGGQKYLFELGLKSNEPRLLKSKWLFLETLSKFKSYHFNIITTRGHVKFADTLIADLGFKPTQLIKL